MTKTTNTAAIVNDANISVDKAPANSKSKSRKLTEQLYFFEEELLEKAVARKLKQYKGSGAVVQSVEGDSYGCEDAEVTIRLQSGTRDADDDGVRKFDKRRLINEQQKVDAAREREERQQDWVPGWGGYDRSVAKANWAEVLRGFMSQRAKGESYQLSEREAQLVRVVSVVHFPNGFKNTRGASGVVYRVDQKQIDSTGSIPESALSQLRVVKLEDLEDDAYVFMCGLSDELSAAFSKRCEAREKARAAHGKSNRLNHEADKAHGEFVKVESRVRDLGLNHILRHLEEETNRSSGQERYRARFGASRFDLTAIRRAAEKRQG